MKEPSDTTRTLQEQCYGTCYAACERIDQLEHALAAANAKVQELKETINRSWEGAGYKTPMV